MKVLTAKLNAFLQSHLNNPKVTVRSLQLNQYNLLNVLHSALTMCALKAFVYVHARYGLIAIEIVVQFLECFERISIFFFNDNIYDY